MTTREEALEIAKLVVAGKSRSYVQDARKLAGYLLQTEEDMQRVLDLVESKRDEQTQDRHSRDAADATGGRQ